MNVQYPGSPGDAPAAYRQLPHNLEAEQELLGAMLVNNEAYGRCSGFLMADHFHHEAHQRIYRAISTLIERGQIANPVTLKGYFEGDAALANVGGAGYLARLAAEASTIISIETYGQTIYDMALRREIIRIGEGMVNTAYEADLDTKAVSQIESAEAELFAVAEHGKSEGGFMPFEDALKEAVNMAAAAQSKGGLSGVGTGLRDLDRKLGGLHRSDLIILAGRPAMGKTALATTMAFNAARAYNRSEGADGAVIGFFSLEMSAEQLATRILSEQTRISSERLRKGEIGDEEFTRLVMANEELQRVPFFIDHTGGITISALRTRARRLKRQHKLGLIVVDYLQLVESASRNRGENRVQDVSEVSRGLKSLAKELDVPVLALSQLSRQVESRDDKRPQLSDLRESGAIEQDADVVMFVYREEYYEQRKEPQPGTPEHAAWQEKMSKVHNLADVIIGKHRHGPTGNVTVHFEAEFTRFSDAAQEDHYPERI